MTASANIIQFENEVEKQINAIGADYTPSEYGFADRVDIDADEIEVDANGVNLDEIEEEYYGTVIESGRCSDLVVDITATFTGIVDGKAYFNVEATDFRFE